jgi:hypothetical protein
VEQDAQPAGPAGPGVGPAAEAAPGGPGALADGVERRLDPRHVELERLRCWIASAALALAGLIGALILLAALRPVWWVGALALAAACALLAALAWFPLRWPELRHRHTSYRIDERGIEIREGVLWRRAVGVPRTRVQHTDVSQGPIERGFGLGTLLIYTAGTEHARVSLSGLDHATALSIRDYLIAGGHGDAV